MRTIRPGIVAAATVAASLSLGATTAFAASVANDNAGNYGTSNPWTSGSNGGSGFAPWIFGGSDTNFYYLSDATNNGLGSSGLGGSNINSGGQSWGTSVGGGRFLAATRPFTVGGANASTNLAVGQSVSFDFDNGWIQDGGVVGLSLQDSANLNQFGDPSSRFEYFFAGGSSSYTVNASPAQNTVHTFTEAGMRATFTLTGADTYAFSVTFLDTNTTETFSGNLAGASGGGIDRIRFFNFNAGYGANFNQYFNNLAVTNAVPEPTSLAAAAMLGLLALRRRRD